MQPLIDSLAKSSGSILLILLVAVIGLGALLWVQLVRTNRLRFRIRTLLEGARGENIERMLYEQLRERVVLEEQLRDVRLRLDSLESRMLGSKRFMGVVRYDAFEEVGGSQSFALALYDERGEGIVLSSLVGRSDCRVYCKALVGGRSDRGLSNEEKEAISIASSMRTDPALHR